jgi:histidinol-phosphate aminotransferase
VYPIATTAAGARLIQVPMRGDSYDLDGILAALNGDTRIVFIANPNNPTGTLISPAELERFMDRLPAHVLLVLDEAYAEFAQHFADLRGVEYTRSLDWVRQGRNLVVLRTFSKAQGLAGMRVGYGFGPSELIRYFARVRVAFSVTAVSEAAALAALSDEEHIRKTLDNNAAQSKWLTDSLTDLGFRVVPTWANFIYVETGEDAAVVAKRLQAEGIIVRPLTGAWGAPTAIRVTIGTAEQNRQFMSVVKRALEHATV